MRSNAACAAGNCLLVPARCRQMLAHAHEAKLLCSSVSCESQAMRRMVLSQGHSVPDWFNFQARPSSAETYQ